MISSQMILVGEKIFFGNFKSCDITLVALMIV
jgi:hypothetical protein